MKTWIETRLVEPPEHTVSGRFGSCVMFVAYSRLTDQWLWLQPGGIVEKIAEPQALFLDDDYIVNNLLKTPRARREKATRIHRQKRGEQLLFTLFK
jgi:hypothetical protein